MGQSRIFGAAIFAAALASVPLAAQGQEIVSETQDAVPPHIPTSAFAADSALSGAQLSPDGSKMAMMVRRDGENFLSIFDAGTRKFADGVALGDDFNFFRWAGNERILISVNSRDRRNDFDISRLLLFNMNPRRLDPLVLRRMSADGDNIDFIDPAGRYALVSMAEGMGAAPAVWRFDLTPVDGELPDPVEVQQPEQRVFSWVADNTGTIRIGVGYSRGGKYYLRYRSDANSGFRTMARTRGDEEGAFDLWDFMGLRAGSDIAYALTVPEGSDRRALVEFDFSTGEQGRTVISSPDEDVRSVYFDDAGEPISVGYFGNDFRREWLDEELRDWRDKLGGALPGSRVTLLDISEERERMLVLQSGSADPGALYVFTPETRELTLFAEYRPEIRKTMLSEPRSIRYDARDGTSIQAYLTLPKGRAAQGLPLIVHPHGGPYGIRDTDNYDDMVQLLANRGYAVIQPNFRGSGGFGEAFERLGDGQIGRAMQDDLDDAVAHLVAEGVVDPARVCMLGASYGGFAAVWAAIRNPEIYRCAASFAGVMHFERQLSHDRDYLYGRNRGRHTRRVDGDQTDFDLDDVSPAVQIARLTRPVLLVHGREDSRVPYWNMEMMLDRAKRAGVELESLTLEESGHSFADAAEEQAYYDAVLGFLARHNPAD